MKKLTLALLTLTMLSVAAGAKATTCSSSSITDPVPFMGMSGDILTLTDGSMYKVGIGEYNYLYSYYPNVKVCDGNSLIIGSKTISVSKVGNSTTYTPIVSTPATAPVITPATNSTTVKSCDNTSVKGTFIAQMEYTKGGNTVTGVYRIFFDGTTDSSGSGKVSFTGIDSINSLGSGKSSNDGDEFEGLTNSTYMVIDARCALLLNLNLPSGTIRPKMYLDQTNNTKPYTAKHGTGFVYLTKEKASATFNMTAW
jgi:hypothetical protein